MALEVINDDTEPAGRDMVQVLRELQSEKVNIVDGAGANTNIAIAGIALVDTLKYVHEYPAAGGPPVDRTGIASITSAGNIRLTASTAGNKLVVAWYDKPAL